MGNLNSFDSHRSYGMCGNLICFEPLSEGVGHMGDDILDGHGYRT